MRDRRIHAAFVGLMLALPLLIEWLAPGPGEGGPRLASGWLVAWVELVVFGGILFVSQQRLAARLVESRENRPMSSSPSSGGRQTARPALAWAGSPGVESTPPHTFA